MRVLTILAWASLTLGACAPIAAERNTALRLPSPRASHASVVLPDGRVLLLGGCVQGSCDAGPASATVDIFDPRSRAITQAGSLVSTRIGSGAVVLADSRVLVVGGWAGPTPSADAEIFDPASGRSKRVGSMRAPRADAAVAALPDGRVLVAGGFDGKRRLASAEVFDPATESFVPAGNLAVARAGVTPAALGDGRLLIAGGSVDAGGEVRPTATAELFDPSTLRFTRTGDMREPRYKHGAVALGSGEVLIVAGSDERDYRGKKATLEIYSPATGAFRAAGRLHSERFKLADAIVLLPDGKVLIAGGAPRPEIYDPRTGQTSVLELDLGGAWNFMSADLLPDGRVLLAGGYSEGNIELSDRAWLLRL